MMKQIRKMLAVCTLLALVFTMWPPSFAQEAQEAQSQTGQEKLEAALALHLGLMENGKDGFMPQKNFTNREAVLAVGALLGLSPAPCGDIYKFYPDVTPDDDFAGVLKALVDRGLVRPNGVDNFAAEENAHRTWFYARLLDFAGYGNLTGIRAPNLEKGVSKDGPLTRGGAPKMQ